MIFDLSKYQICFVVLKKSNFWWLKFRSVLLYLKKWFLMTKIQICFVICFTKNEKDFLRREFHSQSKFMQSWIKINTNTTIHNLFLYFNNLYILRKSYLHLKKDANQFWFEKNLDLQLIKMQISFCLRKLRSTFKEDVDLFLYWEKLRYVW